MRRSSVISLLILLPWLVHAQSHVCSRKSLAGFPTPVPASVASQDIDVTYYRLAINIATAPRPSMLTGAVTVSFRSLSDSLRTVSLDLTDNMIVDSVIVGASRASFIRPPSALRITLARTYPHNSLATCAIYYHGIPQRTGFGSFVFGAHNSTPWVWSLSEPYGARDWWPCKDHPSDKADSADIVVTCDSTFRVASNGRLIGVTPHADGTATWQWAERYPISTYLISIALTNYAAFSDWFHYTAVDSMQILNYVLPEHLAFAQSALVKTVDMLRIFSNLYGLYPFIREKYGHATFGSGGAMEHQTMTSTTSYEEYVIAHELAHQWFGDMITCRTWVDLWLNEGFATYSEALYGEQAYGKEVYRTLMFSTLEGAKKAARPVYNRDTTSVPVLFDDNVVYNKGGSVLHMLRHVLGDSLFFKALRTYASDPLLKYGTATTQDFQRDCESAAGRPLDWFFNEWIYGDGYPTYHYLWKTTHSGDTTRVLLSVQQETNSTTRQAFVMPLDVRFTAGSWDTTVVVQSTAVREDFVITVPRAPERVSLDPDLWVLRDVVSENELLLPTDYALLQNYPNPFNPGTTIAFDLPSRTNITLAIYTIAGQEVRRLVDGRMEAGHQRVFWDGTNARGNHVATGAYMCRLVAGNRAMAIKMLYVK